MDGNKGGGSRLKVALLCSGLGTIARGHEVFARSLFELLDGHVDMTLFKGAGKPRERELVAPCLPRNSPLLQHIHIAGQTRWADSMREQERCRIEHETFAYAALPALLAGDYDIIHCLEQEVCTLIHANRHLFRRLPRIVFSNGGAIPAADLPPCDFVQEHTPHNHRFSAKHKAFMIPHGVDLERFRPGLPSSFRERHQIPADAEVVVSVGTIGINHKRMDHVIRELAPLKDRYFLVVAGQESAETPGIKALGRELLGDRVLFTTVEHAALPELLAAADVFVLGSLFETFGIAYIEAMAMGLPVVCTEHPNQQQIVQQGVFIDMARSGALTRALRDTDKQTWQRIGKAGRLVAEQQYGLPVLRQLYVQHYQRIANTPVELPTPGAWQRVRQHGLNLWKSARDAVRGRAH